MLYLDGILVADIFFQVYHRNQNGRRLAVCYLCVNIFVILPASRLKVFLSPSMVWFVRHLRGGFLALSSAIACASVLLFQHFCH